jgi:hypothetical protein
MKNATDVNGGIATTVLTATDAEDTKDVVNTIFFTISNSQYTVIQFGSTLSRIKECL